MSKKNKVIFIIMFVLLALPIPLSMFSWIGTVMQLAAMGRVDWATDYLVATVSLIAMILAGTYMITYLVSLILTLVKKRISVVSFLPVFHIIAFIVFYALWDLFDKI